jgi:hypothetical protein
MAHARGSGSGLVLVYVVASNPRIRADQHRSDPTGLMSAGILVVAWLLVAPALFVEVWAAESASLRWFARGAACIATAVLAWFGTLPVGLRFFGSRDPVSNADMRSAVMNSLVLLVGYLLMLLLGVFLEPHVRRWAGARDLK